MSEPPVITTAKVHWSADGQPLSDQYDDVYFSRHDGLAETRFVFLEHNQLAERWQNLEAGEQFVIAETGFGSGLNFLAAWQLWQQVAHPEARLHFISVERFPLLPADLQQALALWPQLQNQAQALQQAYPQVLAPGFHRLDFGPVRLTLILDDASAGLAALQACRHPAFPQGFAHHSVDAWFLDGFAPAKNPEMWQPPLFERIAQLSHPGTTLATFTCAGPVKRGLQQVGFTIAKVPGYGRKREMLTARFGETRASTEAGQAANQPQRSPHKAWAVNTNPPLRSGKVAVIGAGLAGCHSARALAERGLAVALFDQSAEVAQAASGNPQGVLYAKLGAQASNQADFNLQALLYALRHYRQLAATTEGLGDRCGVLQLAQSEPAAQLQQQLVATLGEQSLVRWLTAEQASAIAGTELQHPGLYFADAGWLQPTQVCKRLSQHPNIQLRSHCRVQTLAADNNGWQLLNDSGQSLGQFDSVVIANANDCRQFSQTAHLPVKPVRGQITQVAATANSQALQTVICGEGYVAPALAGQHCLGATFCPGDEGTDLRPAEHQRNLAQLAEIVPALVSEWRLKVVAGRAALRCTTPDYLPLVGPVAMVETMDQHFAALRKNALTPIHEPGAYHPGLFVNVGHGSRGLAYTPLAAQLLAAHLLGEPSPVSQPLAQALHPARFIIRDLTRNRR
ncbi:bifunctional tRNA (5-methylaminomethyl-2-thiouridine)(34)-methyltransferase MnmD/FAD-dependent 5-carboxymethylaminomethyl-2-thiouridine(34) oxidoreductase MnmC [Halioxenophilus sp. WMMB6]|uniref:bifunctional tRNA (5-methylaminomethyl-2-thiouridine)(34)-methyltransferase MnmD/FAD-dependent 5-carboxymethylaminomethyl-2-thiouridine(34) oxidoreductase MnmC n=1 Tax=Halioxenophilus sp. WMMB6 TaxID=3073815 RepID=UPI00295E8742|nr:bifunctional tRNA (5-methylaminomethyl-2-thiouridine)(34)-methyltransferase MnmD/FAD-dependent 5-carboxymethylaminomethyl-2-thiouridine(34) oxidoreductase MnmC [Halioxenophilus sp. WMMB6]